MFQCEYFCQIDVEGSYYPETGLQVCDMSPWEPARVECPNPQLMLCYTVESGCYTSISLKFVACGS